MTGPTSVLLAGGGSAGHISPMLALADYLRGRDPGLEVTCLGTAEGMETRLVPARGYPLRTIPRVPFERRPSMDLARLPGRLRAAEQAAAEAITRTGAEVVVGFGGFVSTPAYLAARRLRVPIVVHEQNARPGLANRVGARLTSFVATTFRSTALPHAVPIGMPLRAEIASLDRGAHRAEAFAHFGLDPTLPTLLVTGGSLGAVDLNVALNSRVRHFQRAGIQVLHLAGGGKEFVPDPDPDGPAYLVLPFTDRMDLAYSLADLVVARAGANTICELTAVGLPAVYVPLRFGNGEQRLNAVDVIDAGGGILVDNRDFTPDWIDTHLIPLVGDQDRLDRIAANAARIGSPNAAERLADLVDRAYRSRQRG